MAVQEPPAGYQSHRERVVREDYELDLSAVVGPLVRQIGLVALIVLVAVAAAGVFTYLQPRTYDGVAKVFISRPKTAIALEPRFANRDEFEIRPFFTQAKNPDVEKAVQNDLRDELTDAERQPGALTERLQVRPARDDSALMELHFSQPDERKAAALANAWAKRFVEHAQATLNPAALAQRQVQAELKSSAEELARRDAAVRDFGQRSGIGLALRDEQVKIEVAGPQGASGTASSGTRLGARGRELSAKATTLATFQADRDQLRLVLAQARALRGAGVGLESLATDLGKVGAAPNQPPDQVVAALEAKDRALGQAIDQLLADVQSMQASLAQDVAQLDQLERDRDVARESYLLLAKKAEENKVALASEWAVVAIFSWSPDPAPPEPRPWLANLGAAAAGSLVLGAVGALWLDRRRGYRTRFVRAPLEPAIDRSL